jgi:DNA-binding MarR family transcriptional regulator
LNYFLFFFENGADHQYIVSIDDVTEELMVRPCPHHVHRNTYCKHTAAIENTTDDGMLEVFSSGIMMIKTVVHWAKERYVYIHVSRSTRVDLSATKDCHCLAARRRAREITRLYEEKLRPYGLRATQFSILAMLALKGPTPLGELADVLGLERTTLTRSANRLENEGWVTEAEAEDARKRRLRLTTAGREKVELAYPAWKEAQDEVDRKAEQLETE